MRAVSPQRYLWDNTDYHVRYRDLEVQSPKRRRRRDGLFDCDEPVVARADS